MKRHAPATARNSEPLAKVLAEELPESGLLLEIASGTGEHAVFMARRFPDLQWQPSDLSTDALQSVDAWREEADLDNLRPAIALDAASASWPVKKVDAILCVNMVHISPWAATEGLFAGAARLLSSRNPLAIYGPFLEEQVDTASSNLSFDKSLRSRDSDWGLRDIAALDRLASLNGMSRTARHEMPANNLTLIYRKLRHKK